jgi:xanthine dehydrogenase accessory factor
MRSTCASPRRSSHEHALDLRITEAILRRADFAFCGLIGSKTKRATFSRRLAARGVAPAAIERLTCPIGAIGIAGRAPEVIAIAAVAELLRVASAVASIQTSADADAAMPLR